MVALVPVVTLLSTAQVTAWAQYISAGTSANPVPLGAAGAAPAVEMVMSLPSKGFQPPSQVL